ncbi:fimbrial protein [Janthinobacterium sp. BJB446]|uniref:fimbrial protein n=1 Tax=Janthinobacterium sp. BJB446 TaxID=2048009 RepID=UPI000C0EB836|nr:fimbrial protein [Janthinobacterium sp. BJB446]PHV22483.1 fimbrial protein [Janthinobacterium sp. BJB446]
MNIRRLLFLLAGLLACTAPRLAQAALTSCVTYGGPFVAAMPLQVSSLTVARDLPVGTWLYQQYFQQTGNGVRMGCDRGRTIGSQGAKVFGVGGSVIKNPALPAYASGFVYATGVPGIGVMWWGGRSWLNDTELRNASDVDCNSSDNYICTTDWLKVPDYASMTLIKTGPVGAGVIQASDLGRVSFSAAFAGSGDVEFSSLRLTGSISVVSKTCTTSDVNVPMGRRMITPLKGIGKSTPTVSFEIRLTDCPWFPGTFNKDKVPISSQDGVIKGPEFVQNKLTIRIVPGDTAIDASNGVLGLTAQKYSATGVGVQLLDESGKSWPLSKDVSVPNINGNSNSLTIKFGARYLQTAAEVKPGWAHAVATYTLNYQ